LKISYVFVRALGTARQTNLQQTFLAIAAASANKMFFFCSRQGACLVFIFPDRKSKTNAKFHRIEQTQASSHRFNAVLFPFPAMLLRFLTVSSTQIRLLFVYFTNKVKKKNPNNSL